MGQWEKSKIAVDCKCRADEGQWEKSEIAVDCKCRGDVSGQWVVREEVQWGIDSCGL